jgi:hypothetical protein
VNLFGWLKPRQSGPAPVTPDIGVDFSGMALNPGADAAELAGFKASLNADMPGDYLAFMQGANGGAGWIGGTVTWLTLWPLRDMKRLHRAYRVKRFAPGLIIFGTNGFSDAYAFDTAFDPWPVIQLPFMEMNIDLGVEIAPNFLEFLRVLQSRPSDTSLHVKHQKKLRGGCEIWRNQCELWSNPMGKGTPLLSRKKHIELCVYFNKNAQNLRTITEGGIPQW